MLLSVFGYLRYHLIWGNFASIVIPTKLPSFTFSLSEVLYLQSNMASINSEIKIFIS